MGSDSRLCQRRRKTTSPGRSKSASLIDKRGGAAGFGQGESEGDFPPRPSVELRVELTRWWSVGFLRWMLFCDLTSAVLKPEAVAVHL